LRWVSAAADSATAYRQHLRVPPGLRLPRL